MSVLMVEAMGGNVAAAEVLEMIDAVCTEEVFDVDSGDDGLLVLVETVEDSSSDVVAVIVEEIISSASALASSDDGVGGGGGNPCGLGDVGV